MAGGSPERGRQCVLDPAAAMEPRPDGRGKPGDVAGLLDGDAVPQWSPGLMAGGRPGDEVPLRFRVSTPQWSPGLMAGGR